MFSESQASALDLAWSAVNGLSPLLSAAALCCGAASSAAASTVGQQDDERRQRDPQSPPLASLPDHGRASWKEKFQSAGGGPRPSRAGLDPAG